MFVSRSLVEHLARGAICLAALVASVLVARASLWLAMALLPVALVAVGALGKLMMVHQALTLSRVAGWAVGLIGAWLLWRVPPRIAAWSMAAAALAERLRRAS